MGKIDAILAAYKAAFENSATPFPGGVFIRPDETGSLSPGRLPVVMISEEIGIPNNISVLSLGGGVELSLNLVIDIPVYSGVISDDRSAVDAEQAHRQWVDVAVDVITDPANRTLGGLISGFGEGVVTAQTGHIGIGTNTFWGLRFVIPIKLKMR